MAIRWNHFPIGITLSRILCKPIEFIEIWKENGSYQKMVMESLEVIPKWEVIPKVIPPKTQYLSRFLVHLYPWNHWNHLNLYRV